MLILMSNKAKIREDAMSLNPMEDEAGYVLYYTSQCPFNAKYVPIVEQTAKENGIPFKAIHIESKEQAQNGAFFEYGTGNCSTFNGSERGDGSTHYTGGGLLQSGCLITAPILKEASEQVLSTMMPIMS